MKIFIWLLLILPVHLWAATNFNLTEVEINCEQSDFCAPKKARLNNLIGEYRSLVHLKETLRIMASDGGYESFSYEVFKQIQNYKLSIKIKLKPTIKEISIGFTDRILEMDPSQLLNMREGEFFELQKLKSDLDGLHKRIETMGYPLNSHQLKVEQKKDDVFINLAITLGQPRVFKRIKSNASSPFVNELLVKKFNNFYNKPFEFTKFKLYLDEAQKELFSYGYYLINLDFAPVIKGNRVVMDVKVSNDKLYAFDFKNLKQEHRDVIHDLLKDLFRKYKRPLSETVIKAALEEHYRMKALLNAEIKLETVKFRNRYMETVTLYRIYLNENGKTRLDSISFIGNSFFTRSDIRSMYQDEAFELARMNYYDEEYLNYFIGFLKSKYIEKGYVQARIIGPNKTFDNEKLNASVEYLIQEGQRAIVRSVNFEGLPSELEEKILSKISNNTGVPFNPIAMTEDLKLVTSFIQEKGYYFGEIINANEDTLVTYSKTGADVDIRYIINTGPMVKLNRIIYLGNNKTRKKVFEKKIQVDKGDIITPNRTREYEASLSATGLFNSVSIQPLRHTSKTNTSTDLIVKVVEREYGLVELAPGFRTDLGLKLTATASYVNIGGMNRAITLRSQINQRFDHQMFDQRRRKERRHLLEHNSSVTYTQGDIFNSMVDFSTAFAYQFKRFYSFDAEILRWSNTFTRDISKRLSTSARYQLEKIAQSDATEERDNGNFQIGAITPSLTYDLRNSQVNPVRGAFFNLSCEFANPFFGSQQQQDLTINYYKLVSRNRFYIPHKYGTVAVSMVAGLQENLAREKTELGGVTQTEGYIPNIKVFRLTGMDIVRGFSDEEINKIPGPDDGSGSNDISRIRVSDKAYLVNFKLEPRYFINDALMIGAFYDAGRVFIDQPNLGELRDSVGLTFKILTPVGTLDFDYGIKLERKTVGEGSGRRLEDPGRFHVSIGFF
jgi:outer membrane protein insertion porin family